MIKVNYRWSESGIKEICDKEFIIMPQEKLCYHCLQIIKKGENAVKLTAEDGDVYMLHVHCADRSCEEIDDSKNHAPLLPQKREYSTEVQAAFDKLFASNNDDERRIRIRELMEATRKR